MTLDALEQLTSEHFIASVGTISSVAGLRRYLARSPFIKAIREALSSGEISEERVRRFSNHLLRDFRPGELFAHELALAAIAVALEGRRTEFAEEFLLDLARLSIAEMPWSSPIARESCLIWHRRPRVKEPRQKEFQPEGKNARLAFWQPKFSVLVVRKRQGVEAAQPFE